MWEKKQRERDNYCSVTGKCDYVPTMWWALGWPTRGKPSHRRLHVGGPGHPA